MQIARVKINGVEDPLGFKYRKVKLSWTVEDFTGKVQKNVKIEVDKADNFENVIYTKEGADLKSYCEILDVALEVRTKYYVRVTVAADNGECASAVTTFETGKMDESWEASWICTAKEDTYHPIFFKNFVLDGEVEKARLYVTGLGLYEVFMNGEKVGDEFLAPFYNDYKKRVQYQTYDVTDCLKADNRIEIQLGNGWYKGRYGLAGNSNVYGSYMTALAEIHIDYKDGRRVVIATDDTWQYKGSDVEASGIYDGEIINRQLWKDKENVVKQACLVSDVYPEDSDKFHPEERVSVPVRITEKLAVKEVLYTPAGETVLDFGQNFVGFVSVKADLPAGTRICLQYGEVMQQDNFYNDNYRGAVGGMTYVSDGTPEEVRVQFTFFGGRYVRVAGWPETVELKAEYFTGCVVHSDIERTGYIETSDKDINQLFSNCLWGQRGNFLDVPTDCPQRNERMGWTGDAQVFSPTASYNMDTRAFFDKYMMDLRDAQISLDGAVPNVAPMADETMGGSSVWGDVATFMPMTMYNYFGDKETLAYYYPLMKDWVDWIDRRDQARGATYLFDHNMTFGDWLALDGMTEQSMKGNTDDTYVSTAYYYASAKKVAEAARILGYDEDVLAYEALADKIKGAFFNEYLTGSGRLAVDSQTAYLVALNFGLYTNKDKIVEGLAKRFDKDMHKLKGGFVGATMMNRVLAENGFEEEAWNQLFNHEFPGWLHCVDLGATTIWERWNSVLDDGSISGTGMNSLNHYSYGSVFEYVYKNIAGIAPSAPAFTLVTFKPLVNWRMKYMNCTYKSVSGTYVSNWKINDDGTITMHFEVPFNCSAKAILPAYDGEELVLEAGSHDVTYKPTYEVRSMFTGMSRVGQVKKNEQAMGIVNGISGHIYGIMKYGDAEIDNLSLEELKGRFWMGINPMEMDAIMEAVGKIFG